MNELWTLGQTVPGPRPQSISKANFVTSAGWDRVWCPERNEFSVSIFRRQLHVVVSCSSLRFVAHPGDSDGDGDCDARKCAIQSWNLNNGNKNYEHEYFNVVAICIRKPLRGPTPALNGGHKMKSAAKQRNLYGPRHHQQQQQQQQPLPLPTSHWACPIRSIRGVYCCLAL